MTVRRINLKWLPLWAVGLFANFYFLLRFLSGDQLLWVRLTNYFLPWTGMMLASCFGLSVVFKNRKLSVVLFIPLFLVGVIYAPLFWNCKPTANAGGQKIKVMSYNIWSNNSSMKACAAVILKESPDILLLQEIRPDQMSALEVELRPEGLNMAFDPGTEQAIISRYPIKGSEVWFWKNRSQKAVLEAPLGPVTVINVHAYKHGWLERHRLMEALLVEEVIPEKGPLILGGDFNTNDRSETYRMIQQHLTNAHAEAGCGFGFTFPTASKFWSLRLLGSLPRFPLPALIRIDHIFYSSHFTTLKSYTVSDSGGSDHLPVVAELVLQDQLVILVSELDGLLPK
jgi:vancomycin resistance protein VanJ